MDQQQRNLIIAIALSAVILFGFQFLMPKPPVTHHEPAQQTTDAGGAAQSAAPAAAPTAPGVAAPVAGSEPRAEVLSKSQRVTIDTASLHGSIDLTGARIDDLTLKQYHETTEPGSPEIVLLAPAGSEHPYFTEFGWLAAANAGAKLPDAATQWTSSGGELTVDHPVDLTWDNGEGLRFTRHYAVDDQYLFTVTESVKNTGDKPVTLYPYALASRAGTPPTAGTWILHEGPIAVLDDRLHDGSFGDSYDYSRVKKEQAVTAPTTGGWLGFTDKYWLVAVIPPQDKLVTTKVAYSDTDHVEHYQADYTGTAADVAPGATVSNTTRIFAGAKEYYTLQHYQDADGIPLFTSAIDFGLMHFITRPIFLALDKFSHWLGNFGLAILLFTLLVKLAFFPLANKSYRAMAKMKLLQPEMARLREQFGDDKARLNQEMMATYKRVGANPLAGCLPIAIQIPVFWSLYKVLYVTIEMRHAPFYGWIHDLSSPDPTSFVNLFGLLPWGVPAISYLHIGVWPLIMGVTMFLQQKLNPPPPDPTQAKMMMMLPVVFTFMLSQMPAGLVIYWSWNNLLSIAQQWTILRRAKVA
jgi:YidC/Oxa1 family membrane protein insertase